MAWRDQFRTVKTSSSSSSSSSTTIDEKLNLKEEDISSLKSSPSLLLPIHTDVLDLTAMPDVENLMTIYSQKICDESYTSLMVLDISHGRLRKDKDHRVKATPEQILNEFLRRREYCDLVIKKLCERIDQEKEKQQQLIQVDQIDDEKEEKEKSISEKIKDVRLRLGERKRQRTQVYGASSSSLTSSSSSSSTLCLPREKNNSDSSSGSDSDISFSPPTPKETPKTTLTFIKLTFSAQMPTKSTPGSAAYDLYYDGNQNISITRNGGSAIISTGISVRFPTPLHYARIFGRSGLGFLKDIDTHVGVIDNDFRGEVKVKLYNHGITNYVVQPGDRIAQLILEKEEVCDIVRECTSEEYFASLPADHPEKTSHVIEHAGFGSTGRN